MIVPCVPGLDAGRALNVQGVWWQSVAAFLGPVARGDLQVGVCCGLVGLFKHVYRGSWWWAVVGAFTGAVGAVARGTCSWAGERVGPCVLWVGGHQGACW